MRFKGIDPRTIAREEEEYAQADLIIVPSEFARQAFIHEGVPAVKLRKVPYGVDLERFEKVGGPLGNHFDIPQKMDSFTIGNKDVCAKTVADNLE